MKKILKLVLGLLLVGSMMFGAVVDTATFGIHMTVPAVHEIKIASADATTVGAFNTAVAVASTTVGYDVLVSDTFYMLIKTNNRSGLKVQAKLEHLKAPSIATEIKYSLKSGINVLGTSVTSGATYTELMNISADATGTGLRVVSKPFLVEVYSDTVTAGSDSAEAAAVGAYSTSVVFELITL